MLTLWGRIHIVRVTFSEYAFSCGSQKATNISKDANKVLVAIASSRFIIFFWVFTRACC